MDELTRTTAALDAALKDAAVHIEQLRNTVLAAHDNGDEETLDAAADNLTNAARTYAASAAGFVNTLDDGYGGGNTTSDFTRAYFGGLDRGHAGTSIYAALDGLDREGLVHAVLSVSTVLGFVVSPDVVPSRRVTLDADDKARLSIAVRHIKEAADLV